MAPARQLSTSPSVLRRFDWTRGPAERRRGTRDQSAPSLHPPVMTSSTAQAVHLARQARSFARTATRMLLAPTTRIRQALTQLTPLVSTLNYWHRSNPASSKLTINRLVSPPVFRKWNPRVSGRSGLQREAVGCRELLTNLKFDVNTGGSIRSTNPVLLTKFDAVRLVKYFAQLLPKMLII